jgi:hypothetical protein
VLGDGTNLDPQGCKPREFSVQERGRRGSRSLEGSGCTLQKAANRAQEESVVRDQIFFAGEQTGFAATTGVQGIRLALRGPGGNWRLNARSVESLPVVINCPVEKQPRSG